MSRGFIPLNGKKLSQKSLLGKFLKPVSNWYINASGYRKVGLRYEVSMLSVG
jgi:hypothetical protein